ncbi:MAG TPA: carboxypeptidase-like regulatory domain-containing protein, partial [Terracidiphilus sp.]
MKKSSLQAWIAMLALALVWASLSSSGQTPGTGAISGSVSDPANKIVARAEVLAVNEATHLSRTVTTTAAGLFEVPLLLPGSYILTVKAPGFAPSISNSIQVTASETTSINVKLALASVGQNVRVSARAEDAELESSTLGGLVDESAISTLPLSSRNYTQILGLSPGVVADLPTATVLGNGTQNVASNGATPTANNIQFNGIDANNLQENSAASVSNFEVGTAIPAPDTIEEFRVQTANFDAAYGRGTGANVDLVSKSGTNAFHGSGWEFVRNNVF